MLIVICEIWNFYLVLFDIGQLNVLLSIYTVYLVYHMISIIRSANSFENMKVVVGVSRQEIINIGFVLFGAHQQSVSVILRKLMLPCGFESMSLCFKIRSVIIAIFGAQLIFCKDKGVFIILRSLCNSQFHIYQVSFNANRMLSTKLQSNY